MPKKISAADKRILLHNFPNHCRSCNFCYTDEENGFFDLGEYNCSSCQFEEGDGAQFKNVDTEEETEIYGDYYENQEEPAGYR